MSGCIDPYGAPEILVEGVAYREMIGTDLVRSAFYAKEQGEHIIRVKLVIPFFACAAEHYALRDFIAGTAMCGRRLVS